MITKEQKEIEFLKEKLAFQDLVLNNTLGLVNIKTDIGNILNDLLTVYSDRNNYLYEELTKAKAKSFLLRKPWLNDNTLTNFENFQAWLVEKTNIELENIPYKRDIYNVICKLLNGDYEQA